MCRRVSGARRLPTAASGRQQQGRGGGGGEKKQQDTHTRLRRHRVPAETHREQTHKRTQLPATGNLQGADGSLREASLPPSSSFFWRRSTEASRQNSLSCFPVALHESMPLRWEEKYPQKAGNTAGLFTLLGAGREGPFSCRMANDPSLNTLLLSVIPVQRGCSWSPREPQRFSGVPLGAQREVKVSRRLGGGGDGNLRTAAATAEIISSIVQNSESSTVFLKTIPRAGRLPFCTGRNADRQRNQVTGSAATNQELL